MVVNSIVTFATMLSFCKGITAADLHEKLVDDDDGGKPASKRGWVQRKIRIISFY